MTRQTKAEIAFCSLHGSWIYQFAECVASAEAGLFHKEIKNVQFGYWDEETKSIKSHWGWIDQNVM